MRAERVGRDTLLAQIVRMVQRGAAQPRADPAAWRTSSPATSFRPSSRCAVADVHRLGHRRAGAAVGLRARQRRRGADHRLPLRAGSGDADVDHGRRPAAARRPGVLIRNAEALELLEKVDTLVVDKTGTLTEGKPRTDLGDRHRRLDRGGPAAPRGEPGARQRAPAGRQSILDTARAHGTRTGAGRGVSRLPREGRHRRGRRPHSVAVGNRGLLEQLGIREGELAGAAADLRRDGQTVMYVCIDGTAGRPARRGRSGQGVDARGDPGAARRGDPASSC